MSPHHLGHSHDDRTFQEVSPGISYEGQAEGLVIEPDSVDFRIWWIHFLLGCTVLLPWNVMITAMPFFLSRLADSPFQAAFSSYLSITFIVSNFMFLAHATASSKFVSHSHQTRISTVSLLLLTFILTISTFVHTTSSTFFKLVLLVAVLQAAASAYLQISVVAVASLFGPKAVQAIMSGQAAVAVAVNAVELVSAAVSLSGEGGTPSVTFNRARPEEASAFVFFAFSTAFLGGSVFAHRMLIGMPVYKTFVQPVKQDIRPSFGGDGERQALLAGEVIKIDQETNQARILRVAKANILYEVAIAYVFVVTLAVFPPITTAIMPTNPGFHPLLFSAVHFLLFNIGDLFGRYLCSFPSLLIWSSYRLLGLSLAHTLFVPLFLGCNIHFPSAGPSSADPLINSDVLFFLILFAFGTSNGYVSSLCMMAAPSLEHNRGLRDKEDVDTAATIGVFCLVGGLSVGSVASFGIRALVCRCNPFVN